MNTEDIKSYAWQRILPFLSLGHTLLNMLILLSACISIYLLYAGSDLYCIFKPLTTILVILIPIIFGNRDSQKYFHLILAALICCLMGDLFLLNEAYFIFGLSSFLIAHLLFTRAFIAMGGIKYFLVPLLILLTYGIFFYAYLSSVLGDLRWAVLAYIAIIMMMCWQGIALYIWKRKGAFLSIAIAVILFLISDSMLALDKFKQPFKLSGFLVLSTYWLSVGILGNTTAYVKHIEPR